MTAATVPQQTIEEWLQSTLRADTTLTGLAPGGVHPNMAPAGKDVWPVVVFAYQSGLTVRPAGKEVIGGDTVYVVKAIDKSRSYARCWPIAQRVLDLLDTASAAPGGDRYVFACQLQQPLEYPEVTADGEAFTHCGGQFRILAR